MWPVSNEFLQAARGSHIRVTRARLQRAGQSIGFVDLVSGSITVDESNAIERTLSATVIDRNGLLGNLAVKSAGSPLAPFGTEIVIESGIRFPDGREEYCPMGVFLLWQVSTDRTASDSAYSITAYDRAKPVQGSAAKGIVIQPGTPLPDAVRRLVTSRQPNTAFRWPQTDFKTLTLFYDDDADMWAEARELAKAGGFRLAFDRTGVCTMFPYALSVTENRVLTYAEGADSTTLSVARQIDADGLANVVVVVGTHSGLTAPVTATAADDNPRSLTYRSGPAGERVKRIKTEKIASLPQAQAMARSELQYALGLAERVTIRSIPNAALDLGDAVRVDSPTIGIDSRLFAVSRIEFPLDAKAEMTVQARATIMTSDNQYVEGRV